MKNGCSAAFFTFSDSLLALGMFAGQRPLGPYAVIIIYWIGQLGITLSAYWQMETAGRPATGGQPSVVS